MSVRRFGIHVLGGKRRRIVMDLTPQPAEPATGSPFEEYPAGHLINKELRQRMTGGTMGKGVSIRCENLQRIELEKQFGPCRKTNIRHFRRCAMKELARPFSGTDNGFQYTEDYDGWLASRGCLCNFKVIVGAGGVQTRSLRCVADMIEAQVRVVQEWIAAGKNEGGMAYIDKVGHSQNGIRRFANILDGDEAAAKMGHLREMLSDVAREDTYHVRPYIYIGDTLGAIEWLKAKPSIA